MISNKISNSLDMTFVEETLYDDFKKFNDHDLRNLIIHRDQSYHYKSPYIRKFYKKTMLYKVCLEREIVMIVIALKTSLVI